MLKRTKEHKYHICKIIYLYIYFLYTLKLRYNPFILSRPWFPINIPLKYWYKTFPFWLHALFYSQVLFKSVFVVRHEMCLLHPDLYPLIFHSGRLYLAAICWWLLLSKVMDIWPASLSIKQLHLIHQPQCGLKSCVPRALCLWFYARPQMSQSRVVDIFFYAEKKKPMKYIEDSQTTSPDLQHWWEPFQILGPQNAGGHISLFITPVCCTQYCLLSSFPIVCCTYQIN